MIRSAFNRKREYQSVDHGTHISLVVPHPDGTREVLLDRADYAAAIAKYRRFSIRIEKDGRPVCVAAFSKSSLQLHEWIAARHLPRLRTPRGGATHKKLIIDHKNGNSLDNRGTNLRRATYSQNALNLAKRTKANTGYRGVVKVGSFRYEAKLRVRGTGLLLGAFSSARLAAIAVAKALYAEDAIAVANYGLVHGIDISQIRKAA